MISLFFECLDIGIETVVCSEVCWVAGAYGYMIVRYTQWCTVQGTTRVSHFVVHAFSFFHTFLFMQFNAIVSYKDFVCFLLISQQSDYQTLKCIVHFYNYSLTFES